MGFAETVGETILSGNSGLDYGDGVEGDLGEVLPVGKVRS